MQACYTIAGRDDPYLMKGREEVEEEVMEEKVMEEKLMEEVETEGTDLWLHPDPR